MVTETQIAEAISAAGDALQTDHLRWITRSAILEHIYWLGLHEGLLAIADPDSVTKHTAGPIMDTIFFREGDDLFRETELGGQFRKLEEALRVK